MIRVLMVDDSAVSRHLLRRILSKDPELEIIAEATNGAQAVQLAERMQPDVITMDIHMPVMDGLDATRIIMQRTPRPIVIISASYQPEEVTGSFRALEAGALTVLGKPHGPSTPEFERQADTIVSSVRALAGVKLVRRWARKPSRVARQVRPVAPLPRLGEGLEVIAIVASTGGPAALATILGALPADTPVPIMIVQHIGFGFDQGLVDWLERISPLRVRLASDGIPCRAGEVLIAPHDRHMGVSGSRRVILASSEPISGHRPSGTYLFRSVAKAYGASAVGVILTGIGDDGARGLVELKQAGGLVIAQDRESSIVYGMPRAAAELGIVDRIGAVGDIAPILIEAWTQRARAGTGA